MNDRQSTLDETPESLKNFKDQCPKEVESLPFDGAQLRKSTKFRETEREDED